MVSYIFRLLERFLSNKFKPQQVSTYALTLYRYRAKLGEEVINVGKLSLSIFKDINNHAPLRDRQTLANMLQFYWPTIMFVAMVS